MSVIFVAILALAGEPTQSEPEAMYYRYLEFPSYVKGGSIEPHWMADGSSFWYAEGVPANTVIYKVDPKANTKTPFFDAARLRQALTPLLGHEPPYNGLPFEEFTFLDESEKAVKFTVEDKEFTLRLDTYSVAPLSPSSEEEKSRLTPQFVAKNVAGHPIKREILSPDRRWFASSQKHNLWLRSTEQDRRVQMTTDGTQDVAWETEGARWSPCSSKLALRRVGYRNVPRIPIVHWLESPVRVEWVFYRSGFSRTQGGMPLPQTEIVVVDIHSKQQARIDVGKKTDQLLHLIGWRPDGSELLFLRTDRELKKVELMAGNPITGASRVILVETGKSFVAGIPIFQAFESRFSQLQDGKRFVWMSERDGWNHLYLYHTNGHLIRRLTKGSLPAVGIETVDEQAGWVYFTAHGDRQRPYDTHLYRVNLQGKHLTQLTEATGIHKIEFSPSKQFFLDTHSTADRPPVVELRRADGTLLQTLSKATIDALEDLGWQPPEEFTVKAADGKTDLYGVLYKPYDFVPDKKYPVIEYIYGGPQLTEVPRTFTNWFGIYPRALAQLGFIVFVVDARGTPGRGKAFQDVVYRNMGRQEIPDHAATLKQLTEKRSYMDRSRMGIFGHSAGGYFTIRALLLEPDLYHVGVASAPVVELDSLSAFEVYMGMPQENRNRKGYEYASNLSLASNLKGKLLLIHGTSDFSAPLSETMKMLEALIQAGKPYDLILFPEQDHGTFSGTTGAYQWDAIRRYFQEHLKP